MRWGCFFIFLFFWTLPALGKSVESASWQKLETGLSYRKIEVPRRSSSVPYLIHAFKISLQRFDLRPIQTSTATYSNVKNMVSNSGALIAVNANFFDPTGKALGLVISNGKQLNPFKNISWWGVFYMEKNIPHIVHSTQWKDSKTVTSAFQAGPRLVVNGKVPRLKSETSQKTAIGITRSGEIILLTTLFPFDIRDLADLMAKQESKGGLGCVEALNFDGGSSSQMYARVGAFELRLPSFVGVPVGLGVFRK